MMINRSVSDIIRENDTAVRTESAERHNISELRRPLGVYIHIPFCRNKCAYCDFCSFIGSSLNRAEFYVDALIREMALFSDRFKDKYTVDTVYFGGGTPSLLPLSSYEKLTDSISSLFHISEDPEVTLECNPDRVGLDYFQGIRTLGINRLSMGMQSSLDCELEALGRSHRHKDLLSSFSLARRSGFENISLDLMYGIPMQTMKSFEKSVDEVIRLSPEHISAYGLKIEEGTAFYKNKDSLSLPDDDTVCDMYDYISRRLPSEGYGKYEISNFAVIGRESRHNLKYWRYDDYIGFGIAAHSFIEGKRFENSRSLSKYLSGENIRSTPQLIEGSDMEDEYTMLAFRLRDGLSCKDFKKRFGKDFESAYGGKTLEGYLYSGHIVHRDESYFLSDKGMLISNYILSDLLKF